MRHKIPLQDLLPNQTVDPVRAPLVAVVHAGPVQLPLHRQAFEQKAIIDVVPAAGNQRIGDAAHHAIDDQQGLFDNRMRLIQLDHAVGALLLQDAQGNRLGDQIIAAIDRYDIADVYEPVDEPVDREELVRLRRLQAKTLNDDAGPLRWYETLDVGGGRDLAKRLMRLHIREVVDEFQLQRRVVLQQPAGAAAHAPDDDRLVALQQRIDHVIKIAIAGGQDDDIARFRMADIGQYIPGDADIGALFARQMEDRVDISHHQAGGRVPPRLRARRNRPAGAKRPAGPKEHKPPS